MGLNNDCRVAQFWACGRSICGSDQGSHRCCGRGARRPQGLRANLPTEKKERLIGGEPLRKSSDADSLHSLNMAVRQRLDRWPASAWPVAAALNAHIRANLDRTARVSTIPDARHGVNS